MKRGRRMPLRVNLCGQHVAVDNRGLQCSPLESSSRLYEEQAYSKIEGAKVQIQPDTLYEMLGVGR